MTRKILAIFSVAAIAYFVFQGRSQEDSQISKKIESDSKYQNSAQKNSDGAELAKSKDASPSNFQTGTEESNSQTSEAAAKGFPNVLNALGACFDIRNQVGQDRIEPTLNQLINSLRGELGDSIAEYEDWSNEHILMSNGEQRRLRIENSADANGVPGKSLRYFKLDKEGLPESIPLTPEQRQNPSDETMNSLRGEGQRILFERNIRSYFQNGEELVTTERNGLLQDLDMAKGNKIFKCSNLNSATPQCKCGEY